MGFRIFKKADPIGLELIKNTVIENRSALTIGDVTLSESQTLTNKIISNGTINGGTINNGTINNGTINNGTISNGTISNGTINGGQVVNLLEQFTKLARSPYGEEDVDMVTGTSFLYFTSNVTNDFQVRLTYNGNAYPYSNFPADTSFTLALAVTNGATAYKHLSTIRIDGQNKPVKWQGGSAPSAGNANSIDVYVFTVLNRGSAIYTILGSQTRFA